MYKPTKRTINWGKDNFIKLFNTKVSCKWRLTEPKPKNLILTNYPFLGYRRVLTNSEKFVPNLGECFLGEFYCRKMNKQHKSNWPTLYGITAT